MKTSRGCTVLRAAILTGALIGLGGITLGASDADAQSRGGRKVIKLGETVIEGTIQKPQAFYILQRSSLNFEGLQLRNSFVPKIIKSVDKAPF